MIGRLFLAGHRGLVGSAFVRALSRRGGPVPIVRTHDELDLEDQYGVDEMFGHERPEAVILAAARVGGIHANATYPADFIRSNIAIQCNVIESAYRHGVKQLLFLGSACVYPRCSSQPIGEDQLLAGPLEPTNTPYAVAKIAGIEMCRAYNRQHGTNYMSVMPTNLYGPGDNFDVMNSHVIPAMIRRFDDAVARGDRSVTFWGTGAARREFLHVDDAVEASLVVLDKHSGSDLVNIGSGADITIRELADLVGGILGFRGRIEWDVSKPDGAPVRRLDITRIRSLGWKPRIGLADGIEQTYAWYRDHRVDIRGA